MKKTFGVFAHVDAGKTTFSERLLYEVGAAKVFNRADKGESSLDRDDIERARGITIFAECATFDYNGDSFCLVDTPGHADFSGETERSMRAIDHAILLLDGGDPVRPRTRALFSRLRELRLPIFIFVNKTDLASYDADAVTRDIKELLTRDAVDIAELSISDDALSEEVAARDDGFAELWLDAEADDAALKLALSDQIARGKLFPVFRGSALTGEGIAEFMDAFSRLTRTSFDPSGALLAKVFRIRSVAGRRLAFIKMDSGTITVRDAIDFDGEICRVTELFKFSGTKLVSAGSAVAGDIAAVAGCDLFRCGMVVEGDKCFARPLESRFRPMLSVSVESDLDRRTLFADLSALELEEPGLSVRSDPVTGELLLDVMGELETETLGALFERRFGAAIRFGEARPLFRETVKSPVVGFGHYEPLRHYAEVQLALLPAPRGSGVAFESRCHVDELKLQYQRAIESHISDRVHTGVLTNSPLDDIKIVLLTARTHEKHTEGGDIREATWRAIRQALEKAESLLLEPFCKFEIMLKSSMAGRALSELAALRVQATIREAAGERTILQGRAPARLISPFAARLPKITRGEGEISTEPIGNNISPDADEIIESIGYIRIQDTERTSSSIFCEKGAGYTASWRETDKLAHTRNKRTDEEILSEAGLII